jgi:hypothetical protein
VESQGPTGAPSGPRVPRISTGQVGASLKNFTLKGGSMCVSPKKPNAPAGRVFHGRLDRETRALRSPSRCVEGGNMHGLEVDLAQ